MNLPEQKPFNLEFLYKGEKSQPLSENEIKELQKYDRKFRKRIECEQKMQSSVCDLFIVSKNKYHSRKEILLQFEFNEIKNFDLFNIVEDALKQSVNDLAICIYNFSMFIDFCKNNHMQLFQPNVQKKLIEKFITDDPMRKKEYQNKDAQINEMRNKIFELSSNDNKIETSHFEKLRDKLNRVTEKIKYYRDKTSSHHDKVKDIVLFHDIDNELLILEDMIWSFYIVMSFLNKPGDLSEENQLSIDRACQYLINGISK